MSHKNIIALLAAIFIGIIVLALIGLLILAMVKDPNILISFSIIAVILIFIGFVRFLYEVIKDILHSD